MAIDLQPFLATDLPPSTVYALFFLLGSFSVAGLSDLRRMSAQREFLEVWLLAAAVLFGLDAWRAYQGGEEAWLFLGAKWLLVLLVALVSWERTGVVHRLAAGDVWAIVAVSALFTPLFVLVFFVLVWVADRILRPLLHPFGQRGAYPFIPVVFVATVATIGLLLSGLAGRIRFGA